MMSALTARGGVYGHPPQLDSDLHLVQTTTPSSGVPFAARIALTLPLGLKGEFFVVGI